MSMRQLKNERQEAIKMIVSSQEVARQQELMVELEKAGFKCTQATLSRDLAQMKVLKAPNADGEYVYVLPETKIYRSVSDNHITMRALQTLGVLSIKFSGTVAVVKTLPGYASHVAGDIDLAQLDCVLGTVAGDDTVMVILEEDTDRRHALNALATVTKFDPNI